MERTPDTIGRFAPSPSGPLHHGSLIAALASYLDARAKGGQWLLRIEDIDPPREVPGASDLILRSLEAHGFVWDGTPLYQSTRLAAYADSLEALQRTHQIFPCVCTRSTLGPGGSCGRRCSPTPDQPHSLRLAFSEETPFVDELLGEQPLDGQPRDLVLRRKDGLYAYALAVVVDDAWQQITHVVRGRDLLTQTPAQLALMRLLGFQPPRYAHLPLLCDAQGNKLSKQHGAPGLDDRRALDNLRLALRQLGQTSASADAASPQELLDIASVQWDRAPLRGAGASVTMVYAGAGTP